jgi:hypothetical protein
LYCSNFWKLKGDCTGQIHNARIGDNFEIRFSSGTTWNHAEDHLTADPDCLQTRPATDKGRNSSLRLSKILAENDNPPSSVPWPTRLARSFVVLVKALQNALIIAQLEQKHACNSN